MKSIVVFYSYEGNTRLVAENIANSIGADIIEIKPEKEMKSKGVMKFLWGGRQAMMGVKPPLREIKKDLNSYDLIFIGTPVWAWSPAPPIRTFLEDHLPKGKRIALFSSCEGGGGKTFEKMTEMARGCRVIGTLESLAPLKREKENTLQKAKVWAKGLI